MAIEMEFGLMSAESAADRVLGVVRGLRKGLSNFVARVMALRTAVRADKFRVAQRLRVALPLYVRQLEAPLRNDVAGLFEVSGLWVRNVGDRRQTKRSTHWQPTLGYHRSRVARAKDRREPCHRRSALQSS